MSCFVFPDPLPPQSRMIEPVAGNHFKRRLRRVALGRASVLVASSTPTSDVAGSSGLGSGGGLLASALRTGLLASALRAELLISSALGTALLSSSEMSLTLSTIMISSPASTCFYQPGQLHIMCAFERGEFYPCVCRLIVA